MYKDRLFGRSERWYMYRCTCPASRFPQTVHVFSGIRAGSVRSAAGSHVLALWFSDMRRSLCTLSVSCLLLVTIACGSVLAERSDETVRSQSERPVADAAACGSH